METLAIVATYSGREYQAQSRNELWRVVEHTLRLDPFGFSFNNKLGQPKSLLLQVALAKVQRVGSESLLRISPSRHTAELLRVSLFSDKVTGSCICQNEA